MVAAPKGWYEMAASCVRGCPDLTWWGANSACHALTRLSNVSSIALQQRGIIAFTSLPNPPTHKDGDTRACSVFWPELSSGVFWCLAGSSVYSQSSPIKARKVNYDGNLSTCALLMTSMKSLSLSSDDIIMCRDYIFCCLWRRNFHSDVSKVLACKLLIVMGASVSLSRLSRIAIVMW